jgi:hypothetical protein
LKDAQEKETLYDTTKQQFSEEVVGWNEADSKAATKAEKDRAFNEEVKATEDEFNALEEDKARFETKLGEKRQEL